MLQYSTSISPIIWINYVGSCDRYRYIRIEKQHSYMRSHMKSILYFSSDVSLELTLCKSTKVLKYVTSLSVCYLSSYRHFYIFAKFEARHEKSSNPEKSCSSRAKLERDVLFLMVEQIVMSPGLQGK